MLTREQWLVARVLANAVAVCNAPFCCGDGESASEAERDEEYIQNVAYEVATQVSSMQIQDAISILELALGNRRDLDMIQRGTPESDAT